MDLLPRQPDQIVPRNDGPLADDETLASLPAPAARVARTTDTHRDAATRVVRGQAAASAPRARMPTEQSAAAELLPGYAIGQYELIRLLGRGGMGEVYLARDLRLGRRVAIKRLAVVHGGERERLLDEARTTALCHHENIVVLHDVGDHDGHPYMVLEYVEGQTLRQWLRERATGAVGGDRATHAPVPPGRVVELMLPVVRALAYAHERRIVHRDLKPENVMLARSGAVKVLDFGIARMLRATGPDAESFRDVPTGTLDPGASHGATPAAIHCSSLIGTLPYMSPEQMNVGVIDHRSDLWAVGIMLFELVAGRHPVPGGSMTDFLRVSDVDEPMPGVREVMRRTAPGHVSEIGPLAAVIERCLIKRPEHRTASARVLLAELEALAPGRAARLGDDGSPFAGLAAFQEADADRFFGRDRDVEHIAGELHSRPLVAIVGPSGAGKSSLVRAGVIPALKRSGEGWDAHVVRPGRAPLAALAGILAQMPDASNQIGHRDDDDRALIERLTAEPGCLGARLRVHAVRKLRRVLVFVDQLEELYTLGAPPEQRAAFLAALAAVADDAASPLRLIVSMRSDFLDRLAEDPHIRAEITRGLVLLPPMDRDGMRAALVRPVEAAAHRFESPALVDRMLAELAATPGALPLLQFTATRLWELRDTERRQLTEASYEQLGGVAGALATHADAVLAGMSSAQQALARAVLERLVTPERTRALIGMAELRALHHDPGAVDDIVQHLAGMRLLVIERGAEGADHTVELVHESLIDRWPTLARWLAENQDDAAFLARLRGAAKEWEQRDRDPGLLWRDAPAREARLWRAHYRGALPGRDREYLDAVFALADRAVRVRRRVVAGIMALMALLLVGASGALVQIRQAQAEAVRQAKIARAQAEEREQARREADVAKQVAELEATRAREARDKATAALIQAQEEKGKAEQSAEKARQAQAAADQSAKEARQAMATADQSAKEARRAQATAEAANARTRAEETRAEQARDREQRARTESKKLLDKEQARRKHLDRLLGGTPLASPNASNQTGEDSASSDH
jgi:serine/threonine protein kinase